MSFCYVRRANCNSRFGIEILTSRTPFRVSFAQRFQMVFVLYFYFLSSFAQTRVRFWLRMSAFFYARSFELWIFLVHTREDVADRFLAGWTQKRVFLFLLSWVLCCFAWKREKGNDSIEKTVVGSSNNCRWNYSHSKRLLRLRCNYSWRNNRAKLQLEIQMFRVINSTPIQVPLSSLK